MLDDYFDWIFWGTISLLIAAVMIALGLGLARDEYRNGVIHSVVQGSDGFYRVVLGEEVIRLGGSLEESASLGAQLSRLEGEQVTLFKTWALGPFRILPPHPVKPKVELDTDAWIHYVRPYTAWVFNFWGAVVLALLSFWLGYRLKPR